MPLKRALKKLASKLLNPPSFDKQVDYYKNTYRLVSQMGIKVGEAYLEQIVHDIEDYMSERYMAEIGNIMMNRELFNKLNLLYHEWTTSDLNQLIKKLKEIRHVWN